MTTTESRAIAFEDFADIVQAGVTRILQEVAAGATEIYWRRRAEQFEWARPRSGEFRGRATPEQIDEQDRRLAAKAAACRARAAVSDVGSAVDLERHLFESVLLDAEAA